MAIGAIRAIHDQGRTVPGDVSVVGFDDVDLAETTDPALTTVHQPVRGKGEAAVRLLLAVIEGRDACPRSSPARDAARRPVVDRPGAARSGEVTADRPKSA